MGSSISDDQAHLILNLIEPSGTVWIMTDGDEAGNRCATELFNRIAPHRLIRWAKLPEGMQPDDCSTEQLSERLCHIEKSDPFE